MQKEMISLPPLWFIKINSKWKQKIRVSPELISFVIVLGQSGPEVSPALAQHSTVSKEQNSLLNFRHMIRPSWLVRPGWITFILFWTRDCPSGYLIFFCLCSNMDPTNRKDQSLQQPITSRSTCGTGEWSQINYKVNEESQERIHERSV